jgi:hypothetical protein
MKLKPIKSILVYAVVFIVATALQFLLFINLERSANFLSSLGLWFTSFEFNASVYYLFRWVGYQLIGWNLIKFYGVGFPIVFIIVYGILFLKTKAKLDSFFRVCLVILCSYFFLSTTIHPWYILFPLALSIFTKYKFPVIWSFLVFLSYYAYKGGNFHENLLVVGLEYGILLLAIAIEMYYLKLKTLRKDPIA